MTINSLYKNPYAETQEDLLIHIDLWAVSCGVDLALALVVSWNKESTGLSKTRVNKRQTAMFSR